MRILCLSLFWCFCRITVFLSASELSTLYGEAESFGQFLDCFIQPLQGESGLPLPFEERISRQLLDIVEESPAQLRSVSPSQLSSYLHKASQSYLEVGAIPEFHAMQTLSFYTRKLHNTQTPEIVLELIELLRIKRLAWKIRQQLHSICRGSHLSTYLALKEEIEKLHCSWLLQKTKWACTFFYDFAEKNSLQQIKQTIGTLYMAQLQEVLHAAWDLQMQAKKQRGEPIAILEGKKILIFTCSYGTGHRMTAAATEQMLSREGAEVVVHDLSVGALLGQDTWRMIFKTLGIYHENRPLNSVDIFNLILKNQYYFLVNTQNKIDLFFRGILNIPGKHGVASPSSLLENSWAKTQLRDLVFLEKPDQIITSYHMDLNPILEIAEEFGIPVLHIPTDYDMKFWEVFVAACI